MRQILQIATVITKSLGKYMIPTKMEVIHYSPVKPNLFFLSSFSPV